jgi:hypothetical protein
MGQIASTISSAQESTGKEGIHVYPKSAQTLGFTLNRCLPGRCERIDPPAVPVLADWVLP